MVIEVLLGTIVLAPLVGLLINTAGIRWLERPLSGWIGTLAVGISAAGSVYLLVSGRYPADFVLYPWLDFELITISVGFHVDHLTVLMLSVVTVVSTCVHLYSIEYMEEDEGFNRFFIYLNLFVFSMLVLVTARNLPMMFIGWEGVGLCSYLLIGFWYEKSSARWASQKAFVVNRLGDFCFLLGIILSIKVLGTVSFVGMEEAVGAVSTSSLTAIGLLLFGGAVGKSAQFPLYVWLPDAMEGPTPVSSLIHAATMVTAGVYLIARLEFLYSRIVAVGEVVAVVGSFTALFAALIAVVHEDMKRILAYSTVSQLGYMFAGVGLGAYGAGVFHLMTHAFFKGLLFLMAGSVMHALHGELNIFRMDALWDDIPLTGAMAVVGGLGLSGFPLVSGFWSKDEILLATLGHGNALGWVLFITLALGAFLTAFYTFRMVFVAFWTGTDNPGYDTESVHESGWKMLVPMGLLAVGALFGGFFGELTSHLAGGHAGGHHAPHTIVMATSIGVSLGGILLAYLIYVQEIVRAERLHEQWGRVHEFVRNQFYVEDLFKSLFVRPLRETSRVLWTIVDDLIVDGLVNLSGAGIDITGLVLRFVQSGRIRHYLVYLAIGFTTIILLLSILMIGF